VMISFTSGTGFCSCANLTYRDRIRDRENSSRCQGHMSSKVERRAAR
jgi:hypothetical protein